MKKSLLILLITFMGCSQKKLATPSCQSITDEINSITTRNKTNIIGTVTVAISGGGIALNRSDSSVEQRVKRLNRELKNCEENQKL